MVSLKYVGKHQPLGMIITLKEELVEELLKSGEWVRAGWPDTYPDKGWTEKRIKEWLELNKIPISYDVDKERKLDKLSQIAAYFENG